VVGGDVCSASPGITLDSAGLHTDIQIVASLFDGALIDVWKMVSFLTDSFSLNPYVKIIAIAVSLIPAQTQIDLNNMMKGLYPAKTTQNFDVGLLISTMVSRRRRRLAEIGAVDGSGERLQADLDDFPEPRWSTSYDGGRTHDFHGEFHRRRLANAILGVDGMFHLGGVDASDQPGVSAQGTPYTQSSLPTVVPMAECPKSDTSAITAACKCASTATTNECAVGSYCWQDSTCNAAANTGGTSTTACTKSDTSAITAACQCASSATTNECAVGSYCWQDSTCNAAANSGGTPTPNQYGTIITTVRLKGVALVDMDDETDALRLTFVSKQIAQARKLLNPSTGSDATAVKVEILSVIVVAAARRRLLATDGVDVKYTVSAAGVSAADLAAHMDAYIGDAGSEGMASDLSQGGTSIETEVISAPAAYTAPDAAPTAARDDTLLFVGIGAGVALAALVVIAFIAVVVVVVVVAKQKQKPANKKVEIEGKVEIEIGELKKSSNKTDIESHIVEATTSNPLSRLHAKKVVEATPVVTSTVGGTVDDITASSATGRTIDVLPISGERRQAKRLATHTKTVSAEGHTYYTDVVTLEATWEHPGEHAVIAASE
jgi:hypothetical protein